MHNHPSMQSYVVPANRQRLKHKRIHYAPQHLQPPCLPRPRTLHAPSFSRIYRRLSAAHVGKPANSTCSSRSRADTDLTRTTLRKVQAVHLAHRDELSAHISLCCSIKTSLTGAGPRTCNHTALSIEMRNEKFTGQELWSLSQGARHGGWNTWLLLQGIIWTSSPAHKSSLHTSARSSSKEYLLNGHLSKPLATNTKLECLIRAQIQVSMQVIIDTSGAHPASVI